MNILDEIIAKKRTEVAAAKKRQPLKLLRQKIAKNNLGQNYFKKTPELQLIAEIKPKSPSAGLIRGRIDVSKLARQFERRGASAISVLTDKKYFGGSLKNLALARKATGLPILRKEFVVDKYQLYESKACGADIVLLIAGVLKSRTADFVKTSLGLKLQPLIEVHNQRELKKFVKSVQAANGIIVGVNNRDLKTFQVDLNTSLNLVKMIPREFISISESGVRTASQLKKLSQAGFHAVLIGSGLAKNPKLFQYFK